MINVTVIGFGYVGSSLALLLLNSKHSIRLNIMEPRPECEGAFLDLIHGMPLYHHKELYINDEELFLKADFIFYAAGIANAKGHSRLSTAQQNIELSRAIFGNRVFVNSAHIIVITNPVDVIAYSVYKFSGVPPERVIGTGTFLDSVRLAYYLSTIVKYNATDFEAVVLGEHGDSQVPIYSMSSLKGHPLLNYNELSKEALDRAGTLTINAADQIRETREGTTYGVSKCAEVLLDYLLGKEEHSLTISMLTNEHYRKLLNLDRDIYIGVPVTIKNRTVKINNQISLLEEELRAFQRSARLLASTIEQHETLMK